MGAARTMTVVRTSATGTANAPVNFRDEVVKLIDVSRCIGCKACQAACLEWNDQVQPIGYFTGSYQNPADLTPEMFTLMRFNEWVNPKSGELEWLIRKDGCMHCAEPGCLAACPAPGAIVQYANGIVDFVDENCIGCGFCVKGCPFDIPRLAAAPAKAHKCTLCSDRVAVGDGPACAKACPTDAIVFGSKQEMLHHAAGRLTDLKSRGFENAGLYNPDGVGGTHVMYVLPHADHPELYSNLPADPHISPWVKIWKGTAKTYAGLAAMAAFVVGAVVHHAALGANRVSSKDEEEARKLIERKE
jgi:formate dehydrogenase iron-sulfur subunit